MSRELFGTDGIRGVAGEYPLTAEGALQVGKAVGAYFAKPGDTILVGRDPRESSDALAAGVVAGLNAMGVNTQLLDVLPTPGLAYLTRTSDAKAGVMITASHNPYTDNGIKVFSSEGGKLPDDTEAKLNALIDSEIPASGHGQPVKLVHVRAYEAFLATSTGGVLFGGANIILDTANGATSGYAARAFAALGAKVTALSDQPDGRNINENCGATHTEPLQEAVKAHPGTIGAAFDGDGDRVMMVDEQGRVLTGDHLLYILAVTGGQKEVIATLMSNMGLEIALQKHGIKLRRVAVGDRYVLEALDQTGLALGGEQSGHIILHGIAPTGDGMLAAIQVLRAVRESGRTLAEWRDEITELPQKLVNFPITDKSALKRADIQAYIEAESAKLGATGRLNVRPSGTEPIARVMVEAPDATERAQTIANHLQQLIKA
jgi:phosphoglucosamine mutase